MPDEATEEDPTVEDTVATIVARLDFLERDLAERRAAAAVKAKEADKRKAAEDVLRDTKDAEGDRKVRAAEDRAAAAEAQASAAEEAARVSMETSAVKLAEMERLIAGMFNRGRV